MNPVHPQPTTAGSQSVPEVRGDKFLTLPNLLSLSRGFLAVLFLVVMLSSTPPAYVWGCILIAIAALTDKLDGLLARKYHQTTEWGRILDPLADKLGIAIGVIVLLQLTILPLWFVVVVFGRDLLILAGGLFLKLKKGIVLPSNEAGKWTVGVTLVTIFLLLVRAPSTVTSFMMGVVIVMAVVSFALYLSRFIEVVKNPHGNEHGPV